MRCETTTLPETTMGRLTIAPRRDLDVTVFNQPVERGPSTWKYVEDKPPVDPFPSIPSCSI